jgi:hypothetical protein
MQIGLMAADGLVLASDTKWTLRQQLDGATVLTALSGSKIAINEAKTVAVTCAGDMAKAYRLARAILAVPELETESDVDVRMRRIWRIGSEITGDPKPQCLIAFSLPEPTLFLFQWLDAESPECIPIPTYAFAGDTINSAMFWPMRYYERRDIEKLKRLAAHTVIAGSEVNCGYISGLEIVCCKNGIFERLTDTQNHELETHAKGCGEDIGRFILGNRRA